MDHRSTSWAIAPQLLDIPGHGITLPFALGGFVMTAFRWLQVLLWGVCLHGQNDFVYCSHSQSARGSISSFHYYTYCKKHRFQILLGFAKITFASRLILLCLSVLIAAKMLITAVLRAIYRHPDEQDLPPGTFCWSLLRADS